MDRRKQGPSSPDTEASTSASKPPASKSRGKSRRTRSAAPSSVDTGQASPSTATSDSSTGDESKPSSSSLADSPASPSRKRARSSRKTTTDGSGPSLPERFAHYDLESCSWRTFPDSEAEGSGTFSGIWPRAGTMRSGTAYRLQPSVPRTFGTESGSWPGEHQMEFPTPTASKYSSSGNGTGNNRASRGRPEKMAKRGLWPTPQASDSKTGWADHEDGRRANLKDRVLLPTPSTAMTAGFTRDETKRAAKTSGGNRKGHQGNELLRRVLLPTPTARDWKGPGFPGQLPNAVRELWPTPRASDDRSPGISPGHSPPLIVEVRKRLIPTPTAGDSKASGSRNLEGSKAHAGVSLTDWATSGSSTEPRDGATTGTLNPTWVEWLMGLPLGWTSLGTQSVFTF